MATGSDKGPYSALRRVEQWDKGFEDIIEVAPYPIIIHIEGRVVYANQLAARLVRLPDTARLIGRSIMEFVHPDHRARVIERLGRHEKGEDLLEFIEERFILDDGSSIEVELTSRRIQFKGKDAILVAGRDITDRKKIEREREDLIRKLEEANRKVLQLQGLLPVCAECRRIKSDREGWVTIESYLVSHSKARLTHGLCPECAKKLYPGMGTK